MTKQPLPPPLPPETRTVGQLVAETLRLYGSRFWPSLALGLGPAIVAQLVVDRSRWEWFVGFGVAGPILFTAAYVGGALIAGPRRGRIETAFAAGVLAFMPVVVLVQLYVLPALAWLALVGLAVPAALYEGCGLRASFARAVQLARADFVHALGSLATLVITVFLTHAVLSFLLHGTGGAGGRVAEFLADLVLSPLLFLGAALLYFDQAARVKLVSPT